MTAQHVVRRFEEELQCLDSLIEQLGSMAANRLRLALDGLSEGNGALAAEVVERDVELDRLEQEICQLALRLIALRQPTGRDLRQAFSVYKCATEFERIGDYAANLAKRFSVLRHRSPPDLTRAIIDMGRHAQEMTEEVVAAFVARDASNALTIWLRDQELDVMHTVLFRKLLTAMIEAPANVTVCAHLLFIAKNLERVGDHVTNIAEAVHFLVRGAPIDQTRTKLDLASFCEQSGAVIDNPPPRS